jgi:formate-dependent nitrite reductase membrane component NrfD
MTGLILLLFLAALVAYFVSRGRRKIGLPVTGKHWVTVIVVFVLIVLALYTSQYGH